MYVAAMLQTYELLVEYTKRQSMQPACHQVHGRDEFLDNRKLPANFVVLNKVKKYFYKYLYC